MYRQTRRVSSQTRRPKGPPALCAERGSGSRLWCCRRTALEPGRAPWRSRAAGTASSTPAWHAWGNREAASGKRRQPVSRPGAYKITAKRPSGRRKAAISLPGAHGDGKFGAGLARCAPRGVLKESSNGIRALNYGGSPAPDSGTMSRDGCVPQHHTAHTWPPHGTHLATLHPLHTCSHALVGVLQVHLDVREQCAKPLTMLSSCLRGLTTCFQQGEPYRTAHNAPRWSAPRTPSRPAAGCPAAAPPAPPRARP